MTNVLSTSAPALPTITPAMTVLEAALAYGKAGLYVLPTSRHGANPGKNPGAYLGKNWPAASAKDAAGIAELFAVRFPDACGIALHCGRSGLVLLDVDTENPATLPTEVLRALDELQPPYQTTRQNAVLQGHYLFRPPAGRMLGNGRGTLASPTGEHSFDIRGTNGVVILAPSWHPRADGAYVQRRAGVIPELPGYIADHLADGAEGASSVSDQEAYAWLYRVGGDLKESLATAPVEAFLAKVKSGEARHDAAIACAAWIAREGRAGLYKPQLVMQQLEKAFVAEVMANPGAHAATRDQKGALAEFRGIQAWAVGQAIAESEKRMVEIRARVTSSSSAIAPAPVTSSSSTPTLEALAPLDMASIGVELMALEVGERRTRAREVVTELVAARTDEPSMFDWRDVLKREAGLPLTEFDELVRALHRKERRERAAAWVAEVTAPESAVAVLPSPHMPMEVARKLVAGLPATDGVPHRAYWNGDFYDHTGTRWAMVDESDVRHWLYTSTADAVYLTKGDDGEDLPKPWSPNVKKVADLQAALSDGVLHRPTGVEPEKCIALTNGVLTLKDREVLPHHPGRFNTVALPFAYEAEAKCPAWLAFLESVLPGDVQAHDFLAEWFGYVLSGRTDQQKMAMLVGLRRSGKGTTARVLRALLGPENCASPRISHLGGTFGLAGLIGKSLAVMGDVRWQSRDIAAGVEVLLGITGEDAMEVHRKNRGSWDGRLGVRFMAMSNDTPTFSDASGALGGRMIMLKFGVSFEGREDMELESKLLAELPGILNWSLDGLGRLNERGRFTVPKSGAEEAELTRRLSAPVSAFVDDWCSVTAVESDTIELEVLYEAYRRWCEKAGRDGKSMQMREQFARDLYAAHPGVSHERRRVDGVRTILLKGIKCNKGLEMAGWPG